MRKHLLVVGFAVLFLGLALPGAGAAERGKVMADSGANFETFTNEDLLEVESMGPRVKLRPGESAELVENWELLGGLPAAANETEAETQIAPRLAK